MRPRRTLVLSLLPLTVLWSCIVRGKVTARDVPVTPAPHRFISTRVKAHLADGTTVVYLHGMEIEGHWLLGDGTRYDLTLRESAAVDSLPLDSVVAMESFHETVRPVETVLFSSVAVGGLLFAIVIYAYSRPGYAA